MNYLLVVYLISVYDDRQNLKKFIDSYKNYSSGIDHELLICFKDFNENDSIFKTSELNKVKFIKFIDNGGQNDYDWHSYKRVAKYYKDKIIFFMNCHSFPIVNNWLKKFYDNYEKKTLLGSGASKLSMVNNALNDFHSSNKIKSILFAISNYYDFPFFPNPHIRSNCFMISSKDYLDLKLTKRYMLKKKSTWINESGRNGMTNQLKRKNFNILVVNSDGKAFVESNWDKSNTYALENQSKLIISDKFSRIYENSSKIEKLKISEINWGKLNFRP